MNVETRKRPPQTHFAPPSSTLGRPDAPKTAQSASQTVYCQHGIHHGHFLVRGETVGAARKSLAPLLHLDPKSKVVAVINGQIVGDDHVIGPDVAAVNFMKESQVKG